MSGDKDWLGRSFEQGPRSPDDGPIEVRLLGQDYQLVAVHKGVSQSITVSKYNACRLLGSLAFMLGARLRASVERKIQMG